MGKVLIAYNNDSGTELHDFFESCADEAKQICVDNGIDYTAVCPPDLDEQRKILSCLNPIDEKIELNNKINNNLAA